MADVPGGNGFVNDFVYEDIPDTTHARIWAVWSAFDAVGNRVGTLLDFLKLGLGQVWQPPFANFGGAATGDWVQLFSFDCWRSC